MDKRLEAIESAIETIRPYLLADGGDIKVLEIDENDVVIVELLGACGSCSMAPMTLKAGVEEAIKKADPSIKGVKAINVEHA